MANEWWRYIASIARVAGAFSEPAQLFLVIIFRLNRPERGLKQARHDFVMLFGSISAGMVAVLPYRDDKVAVCMARLFL